MLLLQKCICLANLSEVHRFVFFERLNFSLGLGISLFAFFLAHRCVFERNLKHSFTKVQDSLVPIPLENDDGDLKCVPFYALEGFPHTFIV